MIPGKKKNDESKSLSLFVIFVILVFLILAFPLYFICLYLKVFLSDLCRFITLDFSSMRKSLTQIILSSYISIAWMAFASMVIKRLVWGIV